MKLKLEAEPEALEQEEPDMLSHLQEQKQQIMINKNQFYQNVKQMDSEIEDGQREGIE